METPSSRTTSDLISKSLETTQETPGQKISKEMEALSGMILKAMGDPAYVESVCPSGGCPELKGLLLEVAEKAKEGGDSPEVKACVSKKIPILMEEGYEQKQAIAIAFSMCRKDPSAHEKDLAKEGTSEGAKKGWETRREGGSAPESKPEEKPEEYPPEAERARQQHHQAATDILGQLGGKRLSVMTGARDMVAIPGKANMGGLQMSIPMARGPKGGVNRVRVEVDPSDTYHVEFGRERAGKYTVVSSHEGVYNDQLMDLFEAETGLFLTLHPRKGLEALQAATEDLISKAGTSEGAKLGWETRRSGGEAEEVAERVAGLPSREQWDSMEADVGDIYEVAERANRTVRDIDAHDEAMREEGRRPPRGVRAGPGEPAPEHPKVEEALGKMEDAAPKGVRAAEGLRGVPGVDEAKRKNAEDSMRRWAKVGVSEREMPKYTEVTVDLANMLDSARADHDPKYLEGTEPATKPAVGMARKGLALDLGVQKRFLNLQDLGQYRPTKPEDVRPPRESTRHDGELGLKMDAQKRLLAEEDFKPVRPLRTDPNPVATGLGRMIMPGWARKGGQVAPPSDVPKDKIVGDGLTEMFLPSKKEDETKE